MELPGEVLVAPVPANVDVVGAAGAGVVARVGLDSALTLGTPAVGIDVAGAGAVVLRAMGCGSVESIAGT